MIHREPIVLRFSEIDRLLSVISFYKDMAYDEFYGSPKNFGGATRFILMIAKYTIEIASQITFDLKIKWQGYPQLFEELQKIGAIDKNTSNRLKHLSDFYLEKTLTHIKIQDVYKMASQIDKLFQTNL